MCHSAQTPLPFCVGVPCRTADTKEDAHSPVIWGFFWSHMGWYANGALMQSLAPLLESRACPWGFLLLCTLHAQPMPSQTVQPTMLRTGSPVTGSCSPRATPTSSGAQSLTWPSSLSCVCLRGTALKGLTRVCLPHACAQLAHLPLTWRTFCEPGLLEVRGGVLRPSD